MSFNWAPVYANAMDSMFFVMLTPIMTDDAITERGNLAGTANTIDAGVQRITRLAETRVSTGFVVGMIGQDIGILTAAHTIDHLYRASRPIRPYQINQLFTVSVLCGHYENGFREAGNMNAQREYGIARVAWIDCQHDLMLVAVPVTNVMSFGGGGVPCPGPHPAMLMCRGDLDSATQECLMVSWPSYKPELMTIGRLGARRTVNQISQPNRFEYAINLLEVQMPSGEGSSGAPLLNRRGEVIGVLHAVHVHDKSHSYFIHCEHARAFLRMFRIQAAPLAPPDA